MAVKVQIRPLLTTGPWCHLPARSEIGFSTGHSVAWNWAMRLTAEPMGGGTNSVGTTQASVTRAFFAGISVRGWLEREMVPMVILGTGSVQF